MELSPNQSALILEISNDGEISIDVASGDPKGNRTPVPGVRGRCPDR